MAAMDGALRAALRGTFPHVDHIKLTDYRVRDLDSSDGTNARVRVLTEHTDVESTWGSVGVHTNVIDSSWTAVADGLVVGLLRDQARTASGG